jgi:hypothetical protein
MADKRDCEHGHLARSCEICELIAENGKLQKLLHKAISFIPHIFPCEHNDNGPCQVCELIKEINNNGTIKEQPKQVTEEEIKKWCHNNFIFSDEYWHTFKKFAKDYGFLKEKPEPKYQWLIKNKNMDKWENVTNYMTKKLFLKYCGENYVYERIESSKKE